MGRVTTVLSRATAAAALAASPAGVRAAQDVVVGSAITGGGGQVWTLDGAGLSTISTRTLGGDVTAMSVEFNNAVAVATTNGNGTIVKRAPFGLRSIVGNDGFGAPIQTLASFPNEGFSAVVGHVTHIGYRAGPIANNQVRNWALDGITSGPGQYGDGGVADSIVTSAGDLAILYPFSTLPSPGDRGRVRLFVGGDLASSQGDHGLGANGGTPIYGLQLALQQPGDNLVIARDDGTVQIRATSSTSLPQVALSTPFAGKITGLGTLTDGRVVVGTDAGQVHLRSGDLTANLGDRGGFGAITALAVQKDNTIVVGNAAGDLWLLDPSLQPITTKSGFGAISSLATVAVLGDANLDGAVDTADVAVVAANQGQTVGNLGYTVGDFNFDGKVGTDDWALFNLGAAMYGARPAAAVPEPASVAAVAAGALGMARARRR